MMRKTAMKAATLAVALMCLLLASCASAGKGDKLQEAQYAWSAAIRWGDFEGAWSMVDPAYQAANPLPDGAFERYKQIQVSGYRDVSTRTLPDGTVERRIQMGVIDQQTMTQHDAAYVERWRYDAASHAWLNMGGLPVL